MCILLADKLLGLDVGGEGGIRLPEVVWHIS